MITDWIYPKKFLKMNEIPSWVNKIRHNLEKKEDALFSKEIYYKINKYSCVEVWRDREWWNTSYKKYLEFWKEVEYYRKKGYETLLPKKRKPRKNKPKYLIVDEEY